MAFDPAEQDRFQLPTRGQAGICGQAPEETALVDLGDSGLQHGGLLDAAPLEKQFPDMSARHLDASTFIRWFLFLTLGIAAIGLLAPPAALQGGAALVAFAFLAIALIRSAGIFELLNADLQHRAADGECQADCQSGVPMPRYAVLVALYKEAEVVGQLLDALDQLDYPKDRLQVSLIVEKDDAETRAALRACRLGAHMRVVVVPDGIPRTKPRALNYALASAVGDYVVVYDAEDLPEPGQLRCALKVLKEDRDATGCVQAHLDIYNSGRSFFTRQFTIEYCALFKAILPALERFGLPVPLGGTSNHFPRQVLERAGGWDAFNVTEDADLGIRLARLGYKVKVVQSTTWEEAPPTRGIWLGQRTRWLKGWVQTYLVHMRHPLSLWRDLGTFRFLGFQVLMGGMILSALVHPWFYVGLVYSLVMHGGVPFITQPQPDDWLLPLAVFNLLAGYISAMLLGALAVATGGRKAGRRLAWRALAMPVYWLLISFAGYRALWQLATTPFVWEKTPHAGAAKGDTGQV